MDFAALVSAIIELGITPTLLLVFILIYFKREKRQDKQYDELRAHFKERVDSLLAEGVRREDIMRTEFAKREQTMRNESSRREEMFARSIDNLDSTMVKISKCMDDMNKAFFQMDFRLQNIEGKITKGGG